MVRKMFLAVLVVGVMSLGIMTMQAEAKEHAGDQEAACSSKGACPYNANAQLAKADTKDNKPHQHMHGEGHQCEKCADNKSCQKACSKDASECKNADGPKHAKKSGPKSCPMAKMQGGMSHEKAMQCPMAQKGKCPMHGIMGMAAMKKQMDEAQTEWAIFKGEMMKIYKQAQEEDAPQTAQLIKKLVDEKEKEFKEHAQMVRRYMQQAGEMKHDTDDEVKLDDHKIGQKDKPVHGNMLERRERQVIESEM